MPIPVDINKVPQEIVWQCTQDDSIGYSTGSALYYLFNIDESFFHSASYGFMCKKESNDFSTPNNHSHKRFLKHEQQLQSQYNALVDYFADYSFEEIKHFAVNVISNLLDLDPEAFKIELTSDKSIFYSLKKGSFTIYIQHFIEFDEDDNYDASLVIFNGNAKLPSVSGNISDILLHIENVILGANPLNIKIEYCDALSY